MPTLPAVVHVDLDGATEIYAAHGWPYPYPDDPLFESGLRNTLDFLDRNEVRATLFTIADNLDDPRKRELIAEAARQGHEIASHTLSHPDLRRITTERKRTEIRNSREKLEGVLGVPVRGFRAPGYSMDRESFEILGQSGYEYDSSAFANQDFADRLGTTPEALAAPGRPVTGCDIIELPMPNYQPAPVPFSPSYALLLGTRFFRWGLRRYVKTGQPFVLLMHLTDLAEPLPRERLNGLKSKVFTLSLLDAKRKAAKCQQMVDEVRRHYRFTTTRQLLDERLAPSTAAVN